MEYLRRGKATEAAFARARRATARSDGSFVFIDSNPWGYTRYVLFL
jgi:hypothetical protein